MGNDPFEGERGVKKLREFSMRGNWVSKGAMKDWVSERGTHNGAEVSAGKKASHFACD